MTRACSGILRTLALPVAGLLMALAGCDPEPRPATPSQAPAPADDTSPPDAMPGSCWTSTSTPAVVQTVTSQVLIQSAQITAEGQIQQPARYRTETRQEIVTPRRKSWFQILCAADLTPDLVASLQRALAARGHYTGPITGTMDGATRDAVRRAQIEQGLDSDDVTLETARRFGLAVAAPPQG